MKSSVVENKYLADVDTLIPRPDIALDVLEIAQHEEASVSELARKIEQDPNLTANMLRMANSSYFGFMRQISSIQDVIIRLGRETVKVLAITSASAGLLQSPQEAYGLDPHALWTHSYASAILAEIIAGHAGYENKFSIFTSALLHDVGKIILNRPLQKAIAEQKKRTSDTSVLELERTLLHTDHARIGMALLIKWELPDEIIIPVGFHHTTEGENALLMNTKIVSLVNFLVKNMESGFIDEHSSDHIQELLTQSQIDSDVPNFQKKLPVILQAFFNTFREASVIIH